MSILQAQAQSLEQEIETKELEIAVEKELYDAKVKSLKDEVSILKRVLKTTVSAVNAMNDSVSEEEV